jgi:Tfp pilus assembly protein PilO
VKLRARPELIVVALVLLGLLVADAAVYRPRRARLASLTQELAQAEQQLLYLAGHADDLQRVTEYLPARPPSGTVGDQFFLSRIGEELARRDLTLSRVEPMGERRQGEYTKRSFRLQIEGDYDDFAAFLGFMETLPEVVLVETFEYRSRLISQTGRHWVKLTVDVIGY